ncbi:hypothetical protein H310_12658 [Aphanomyces invadans]|uniref:Uncharacterized protein n=1 Tax=Aphanomyces invadans TaxID=157072 RepID=A0A024TH11_9STRA|nr:hypothetical protein H310_12658 [Aphanomyces invadans]ETV93415.1 hypothetical protein H310_12658 [Aphanomyces invadans]|eukprot:XP_008878051.1 hypothetical protein H310_12658 [Aphanomyces invadans]
MHRSPSATSIDTYSSHSDVDTTVCTNADYRRAYYAKNKHKELARMKVYYETNKDKFSAYGKDYYERNREKELGRFKAYRAKNLERDLERKKQWYVRNRDKILAYAKAYDRKNRDRRNAYQRERRRKLKEAACHSLTKPTVASASLVSSIPSMRLSFLLNPVPCGE